MLSFRRLLFYAKNAEVPKVLTKSVWFAANIKASKLSMFMPNWPNARKKRKKKPSNPDKFKIVYFYNFEYFGILYSKLSATSSKL
jgi:hypothetical protein